MLLEMAILTGLIATIVMVSTYTYFYFQYREKFLAIWGAAWFLHLIRVVFLEKAFALQSSKFVSILFIAVTFTYTLLIIMGTVAFQGQHPSNWWQITGFLFLVVISGVIVLDLSPLFYMWPAVLFIGTAYIYTGVSFYRSRIPGIGRKLTAGAFILLGLHAYDMPLLFQIEWFAPWGYFIDAILRFISAIGIIILYFEKTRRELEKYKHILSENAIVLIFKCSLDVPYKFEYISPAVLLMTGYNQTHFTGLKSIASLIHKEDRKRYLAFLRRAKSGDCINFRIQKQTGQIIWVEQKYNIIYGKDGKATAVEGLIRDITKRIQLEQDVSRLDRLNVAGQMAANLAHEVRNPLTTVRGYLQLLGNKQEFQKYEDQFKLIIGELDRTNSIITEYLALSNRKRVEMKCSKLNDIIQVLIPLIQSDATSAKVLLITEFGLVDDIVLDENEIKQMLINLCRNSIEAMPHGGSLLIRTYREIHQTILEIKDEGEGIPPKVLENLGKPFLTTKDTGTGLGMAICYTIAKRHAAHLRIKETGPKGTTIQVVFPSGSIG